MRAFVALDLPADVRRALAAWRDAALADRRDWRALPDENLHLTLVFLGARETVELDAVGRELARCAAPVPGLELGEAVGLPPRRPRVLAVEIADLQGALGSLHARLVAALQVAIDFVPERRPFRAHVTVARARGQSARPLARDPRARPRCVADPVAVHRFSGLSVTLYRSHLSPAGARYDPLARVVLAVGQDAAS